MIKLRADRRHSDITVLEDITTDRRQFAQWSLAYSGPDTFIDMELPPLLQAQSALGRQATAARLRSLLVAMADTGGDR